MSTLSFCHIATPSKIIATEKIVENIRKYYPYEYYFLGSDAADDLTTIAQKFDCRYVYFTDKTGYPSYDLRKLLLWFERIKLAYQYTHTSHIMMVEDDVWIKKPLTVDDDWEMAGWNITVGNIIPENIIDSITEFSGKRPLTNQYGCCGGSIFKVSTFLNNYDRVIEWFKKNHDTFQPQYGPLGYMDCFMVVFYMLCGKDYSVNPYMTDTHHHKNDGYDYDKFVNEQPETIEIINNYKRYYWV